MKAWENNIRKVEPYVPGEQPKDSGVIKLNTNENPCTCPPSFPTCVCGKKSKGKVITRKPIVPSDEELEENSRSKSSKLRVFERA